MTAVCGEAGAPATYDQVHVMRYMGGKRSLLPFLIPVIEDLARPGELVCDLMAGTHAVGYALKRRHPVLANDVQAYSHLIGLALLENDRFTVDPAMACREILPLAGRNPPGSGYHFFTETYADTYFSPDQCRAIDDLRYAIGLSAHRYRAALYLTALIYAMCYVQSTPGHFAQFLPAVHPRVQPLRRLDVTAAFLAKCRDFEGLVFGPYSSRATRMDYRRLLREAEAYGLSEARVVYVDPPYSAEQYSRFYHLLETMVLYDRPLVDHRARYRRKRFKSGFCRRSAVADDFRAVFGGIARSCSRAAVVVSYGSQGLLPIEQVAALAREVYAAVDVHERPHAHSTLGKGKSSVTEYLVVARR